jgi:hypothetical protein
VHIREEKRVELGYELHHLGSPGEEQGHLNTADKGADARWASAGPIG